MAVAFDAASTATVGGSGITTLSWLHTPVGTPSAVAILLQSFPTSTAITVTYGGTNVPLVITQAISSSYAKIFGLANPPAGPQTVVVTFSTTGSYTEAAAITVTGSDTTTCFSNSNSATATSTAPQVTVTSATGELVVDIVANEASESETKAGGQTLAWGTISAAGDFASGSYMAAGASNTTMSWTLGSSQAWGVAAASFKAAGGGGGGAVKARMLALLGVG